MTNISNNLRFLRIITLVLGVVLIVAQLWYWLFPDTFHYIGLPNSAIEEQGGIKSLSQFEWWGSFFITLLPRLAILYALFQMYQLSGHLSAGRWFDESSEICCTRIAKALFTFVILNFLHSTLLLGLLTIDNPPGERLLFIGIGSDDIMGLVLAIFVLTISHMIHLARMQRDELDEIV